MTMRFDTFDADQVLREYGDASSVAELVAIVRTDIAENAFSLEQAARAGDLERVRDVAHAVKGVASAVAARLVSELAGRVDSGLRRGDVAAAQSAPALVVECRRLAADLETWLVTLGTPTAN